jgi:hypothetical protein
MDFIEKIFGFSPDGGNGMFEVLLFAIPVLGAIAISRYRARKRDRTSKRSALRHRRR